jgi:hypothetical protein
VTEPSALPDSISRNVAETASAQTGSPDAISWQRVNDENPSNEEKAMTTTNRRTPTLIGAGVGLALFLALALLPSLLYGGYAGVLLAGGIFGTPVKATLAVRGLIVFGMVLGVTSVASLFAIGGAAAGAAISVLVSFAPAAKANEKANGAS